MRKLILLALLVAAALPAHAEDILGLAPLRVVLSDTHTNEVMSLTNRSKRTRTYKVTTQDQVMDAQGNLTQQDTFAYSAKRMLRFMPQKVTLAAGQQQAIRVMAMLPENLPAGDYHTHLIFDEVPTDTDPSATNISVNQGFKVNMETAYSVGVPVVIQHGKINSNLTLLSARAVEDKQGQPVIEVTLRRDGNAEASGLLKVTRADNSMVTAPRTMHVYHEVNTVVIQLPLLPAAKMPLAQLQQAGLTVMLQKNGTNPDLVKVTN